MSLLSQSQSISRIILEASTAVACLTMSYFWYQNARSISDSRRRSRYEDLYLPFSVFTQTNQEQSNPNVPSDHQTQSPPTAPSTQ